VDPSPAGAAALSEVETDQLPQLGDPLSTQLRDLRACAATLPCLLEATNYPGETLVASILGTTRSGEWMHQVITLVEAALGHLHNQVHPAQGTLLEAASLLRQQIDPQASRDLADGRGRLLAWQARKVRDYIDSHITGPVLVADLCALIQRSEAHFSRSFRLTFGESPHAFLVRRRVELAAQYMLTTDAPLSEVALRCGFTDQAHLCKHFRQAEGYSPAAWRRAHRSTAESRA
jgi:AraC family transcriptional regulator